MKTLFVVGAGASADFGLPVGSELQTEIANFLRPDPSTEGFGRDIDFALSELSSLGLPYNKLFDTLNWISRTLPLARSIDSFLETQSERGGAISFLGKYAITTLIARGEASSSLCTPNKNRRPDFQKLADTWLGQLWPLINKGGAARIDEKGLDDFAFLTFNYDRCIEQFLFHAFHDFYRLPEHQAVEFVERVSIHHIYGRLRGGLPGQDGLPFGYADVTQQRLEAARNIKTYSEQLDDTEIKRIGDMCREAERIIFLGFSFAPMNTELIGNAFQGSGALKKVLGTAYRMSTFDREQAESWCNITFRRGHSLGRLDNETGVDFFKNHQLLF